jgi:hypothetical protein
MKLSQARVDHFKLGFLAAMTVNLFTWASMFFEKHWVGHRPIEGTWQHFASVVLAHPICKLYGVLCLASVVSVAAFIPFLIRRGHTLLGLFAGLVLLVEVCEFLFIPSTY